MHSLVIETCTWTPTLETGGEIAITRAAAGHSVGVCFFDIPNPDDPPRFDVLHRIGLWRRAYRFEGLARELTKFGVEIIGIPELDAAAWRDIEAYAAGTPRTYAELRTYRYGTARLGEGVAASITHATRHSDPDLTQYPELLKAYLRVAARSFEMTKRLIALRQPKTIVTYNGRFGAAVAISEAARLMDVPVFIHEAGATMSRYEIFSELPQNPKYIQSEIARYWAQAGSEGAAIGTDFFTRKPDRDRNEWESFVDHQELGLLPPMTPGKRQVVFFTSSDYEQEYLGRNPASGIFSSQRTGVAHIARWIASRDDMELTIREHPNSELVQASDRAWLRAIDCRNTTVVSAESPVDSYALLRRADVVISAGSTMGVEAAFALRPSIVIDEAFYSKFGCVYEPASVAELESLLANPELPALPREACLPVGYYLNRCGSLFKYYEPTSLYSGRFLGRELTSVPRWADGLRLAQFARFVWRWLRPAWIPRERPVRR